MIKNEEVSLMKEINPREVYGHEAYDFTPWLAKEENMNYLSEILGIDIEIIGTERDVGGLRIDILGQNKKTEGLIVIENQLEKTDDDHFSRIFHYAAAIDAEKIIWIASEITDKHKCTIDWLNKVLNIFLIKITAYKTNNDYGVTFDIVSKPNNWVKEVKSETDEVYKEYKLSSAKILQEEYWDMLKQEVDKNYTDQFNSTKPHGKPFYNLSLKKIPDAKIDLIFNVQDSLIRDGIYIPKNKKLFNHLYKNKEQIESEIGFKLIWYNEAEKSSKIYIEKHVDVHNKNNWDEYIDWHLENACKFKRVFSERIKNFRSEDK